MQELSQAAWLTTFEQEGLMYGLILKDRNQARAGHAESKLALTRLT
jgi:hypothetical protein